MISNSTHEDDESGAGEPSGSGAVSGYEITIRVENKEVASRLVTNLVRSDCYESIAGLRVAALVDGGGDVDGLVPSSSPT